MKKTITISLGLVIVIIAIIIISSIVWYKQQLKAVDSENATEITIEIEEGTGSVGIVEILKQNGLIKSEFAAKMYIKLNDISNLQAGKYLLTTNMTLEEILNKISDGDVIDERVTITFIEGKNMRWYASTIAEKTNNTEDDVYNLLEDDEYIQSLIEKYWYLTDEILDENIYYPLEGYLYPDTYVFSSVEVSVKEIFNIILNQTDKVLTEYKTQIEQSGYTVHQILTIGSIVEMEGNSSENRKGIASVIYNRLAQNMAIGSDVTTYYAIKVDVSERDLYSDEINTYNPYNTRGPNMEGKLPIGPIAGVSEESIEATLNPSNEDYLYFVSDINGEIHFTKTYEEHLALIEELQKQGLWYEYE